MKGGGRKGQDDSRTMIGHSRQVIKYDKVKQMTQNYRGVPPIDGR